MVKVPLEAPSEDVLGVGGLGDGLAGLGFFALFIGVFLGEVDSLEDLRTGLTAGCFVLKDSDLIQELLGSLLGLLACLHFGVGL